MALNAAGRRRRTMDALELDRRLCKEDIVKTNHPLRFGAALALTVGIGYAACSLVFALFPEAAANFMNALFHGLDFRKLQVTQPLFTFGGFAYALVVLVAWTFALGALFGLINARMLSKS
jgi:uncharacterized protein DUF5676